jgi:hypothetical protein
MRKGVFAVYAKSPIEQRSPHLPIIPPARIKMKVPGNISTGCFIYVIEIIPNRGAYGYQAVNLKSILRTREGYDVSAVTVCNDIGVLGCDQGSV